MVDREQEHLVAGAEFDDDRADERAVLQVEGAVAFEAGQVTRVGQPLGGVGAACCDLAYVGRGGVEDGRPVPSVPAREHRAQGLVAPCHVVEGAPQEVDVEFVGDPDRHVDRHRMPHLGCLAHPRQEDLLLRAERHLIGRDRRLHDRESGPEQ